MKIAFVRSAVDFGKAAGDGLFASAGDGRRMADDGDSDGIGDALIGGRAAGRVRVSEPELCSGHEDVSQAFVIVVSLLQI